MIGLTIAVHLVRYMICAKGHAASYLSHFSAPTDFFFDTKVRVINPEYQLKQDKQKGTGHVYVTGTVYYLIYIKHETK